MVVYSVHWHIVPENIKYANRLNKSFFVISVLCRSIKDAAFTAEWYFYNEFTNYLNRRDLCFSDGEVVYKRMKIDSRGFNPNYLYADDIKEPLRLYNLKSNKNIF